MREGLKDDVNVWESITDGAETLKIGDLEMNSRAYVARFNFSGPDQQQMVHSLSGGQRNRVNLARMLTREFNVLLLDEPTNDLDVDTIRALEEALDDFPGCCVCVSHDRWFLDRVATHILAFEGEGQGALLPGQLPAVCRPPRHPEDRGGPEPRGTRSWCGRNSGFAGMLHDQRSPATPEASLYEPLEKQLDENLRSPIAPRELPASLRRLLFRSNPPSSSREVKSVEGMAMGTKASSYGVRGPTLDLGQGWPLPAGPARLEAGPCCGRWKALLFPDS